MADLVPAPVERVELFEDRASVTRRVALPDAPGRYTVRIGPVTPLLREAGCSFLAADGVIVEEARVHRAQVRRDAADDARAAGVRGEVEALRDRVGAASRKAERAGELKERAEAHASAARAWVGHALVRTDAPREQVEALRALEESLATATVAAAAEAFELAQAQRELQLAEARLRTARQGSTVLRGELVLQVLVRAPGELRVRYTVPCALWRPIHRATLAGDRVAWQVGAMAWNATGEDWSGVTLVCSTARQSDRAAPPRLLDDVVVAQKRDREVVVEARDEVVQVAREGGARSTREVPGVDDGGEVRTFTAPAPVDLPSDGRPVHVPLETWSSPAKVAWVAHPEQSSQVVLRSVQTNAGSRPLLAGPVELYREHGAVGRGVVSLVPSGEPFAIGWGSHDEVRVVRRRAQKVEAARITGRKTHTFDVDLRVTHTGAKPLTVTVRERLPVSELKDVRVSAPEARPKLTEGPDRDGMCAWELTLEPGASRELSLVYTVDAAARVRLPWE